MDAVVLTLAAVGVGLVSLEAVRVAVVAWWRRRQVAALIRRWREADAKRMSNRYV